MENIMKKLNAAEVKQVAKSLKVKNWWNKKRDDLVAEIAAIKGWTQEKPEVIEYLLSGGEIKKGKDPKLPGVKPETEKSAGKRRRPVKTSARVRKEKGQDAEGAITKPRKKVKRDTSNLVTIQQICEELGVVGRIARRKLRGSDIKKPGSAWEWETGHEDIEKVKSLLSEK